MRATARKGEAQGDFRVTGCNHTKEGPMYASRNTSAVASIRFSPVCLVGLLSDPIRSAVTPGMPCRRFSTLDRRTVAPQLTACLAELVLSARHEETLGLPWQVNLLQGP